MSDDQKTQLESDYYEHGDYFMGILILYFMVLPIVGISLIVFCSAS